MAAETAQVRTLARRAKTAALLRAVDILENPGKYTEEEYGMTYETVLKNSVPRTQEITGEDGEAINVNITKYADNIITLPFSTPTVSTESPESI